jgi:transcription antitermination factor NusG
MSATSVKTVDGERGLPWWVVYARHQHEKVVAEMLASKDFEVFLPLYDSVRRWKDRRKVVSMPLFPGYVFVRGGLERRLQVLTTPGVHMILSHGEKVATVPEEEIQAVRKVVSSDLSTEPHPFLRCGERVRVKAGPLAGVEGILDRKKGSYRLILSVDAVNKSFAVEVEVSDVEAVEGGESRTILSAARKALA